MKFSSIRCNELADIDAVSVAIRPISDKQRHIGFFYRNSDNELRLIHQPWHMCPLESEPSGEYLWHKIPLDELNSQHLAMFLELVARSNPSGIPYGISINGISFGSTGAFIANEDYLGLTCATFVICVLHSQSIPIIDFNNWPIRREDIKWQEVILSKLSRNEQHVARQKAFIGDVCRFRPEEVAVAASQESPPHGLTSVEENSKRLLEQLHSEFEKY
jgi:hypothetical protein